MIFYLLRSRIYFFLLAMMLAVPHSAHASYFNMREVRNDNLTPFPKWTGVMSRHLREVERDKERCVEETSHAKCISSKWQEFITAQQDKPLMEQIENINGWGNAHPYILDQLNWGMLDYWETPREFMQMNGDCEDYAIGKYYSLRALGVSEEDMRIMIVQDLNLGGIIHAVLGVYVEDELWILDNQIKQVRPAKKIYHYRPIYGANEKHWWRYYPNY